MVVALQLWQLAALVVAVLALGAGLVYLGSQRSQRRLLEQEANLRSQLTEVQQQWFGAQARLEQLPEYQRQVAELQERLDQSRELTGQVRSQLEASQAQHRSELHHAQEKLALLEQSEQRLQKEFENLANRIFEQKTQHLQQSNQTNLEATLAPFKQQLEAFKSQVTQQYQDEIKQRAALSEQVSSLRSLNQQMAAEAEALTKALKGDSKTQGNWGEVVLDRILNQSGLREGHEYETQSHHRDDDGKAFKPDVVVHLPNEKDVVIDSKVSLVAYERYFNSEDDAERDVALNEHVQSLRQHIKGLGKKNYQQLESVRTLDYVLMFIPIEPAFLLAVDRDPELIRLALEHNIMLVSPTNLLVALRTVNNIWQYEHQNQNAMRIANDAAKLYDKFVGFLDDMQKIGNALESAKKNYDGAMNKLTEGRGNLVGRVENFRKLGVQTAKRIDSKLLAEDDDESEDV